LGSKDVQPALRYAALRSANFTEQRSIRACNRDASASETCALTTAPPRRSPSAYRSASPLPSDDPDILFQVMVPGEHARLTRMDAATKPAVGCCAIMKKSRTTRPGPTGTARQAMTTTRQAMITTVDRLLRLWRTRHRIQRLVNKRQWGRGEALRSKCRASILCRSLHCGRKAAVSRRWNRPAGELGRTIQSERRLGTAAHFARDAPSPVTVPAIVFIIPLLA
jgi:hypothetical protein